MIRVAFYLNNKRTMSVDCSRIDCGNPGMGGTQYMFWYISSRLSQFYSDLDVCLYAYSSNKMPGFLKCKETESLLDAIDLCVDDSIEILVVWSRDISSEFVNKISKTNIKVVSWSHNLEMYPFLKRLTRCKNIVRNICVGKEQLDRLVDHPLYKKSDFIYNTIQLDLYKRNNYDSEKIKNSICFLGSIVPEKGFHKLANIWPKIEKKYPDAQLYVIGGGDLYKNDQIMGKYGIASKSYEMKFIKSLLNKEGNIKSNVHFVGTLGGKEKIELLKKMEIGIPKCAKSRESFNICAIEFEAAGVPVISYNCYSMVEVISNNRTGLLFNNKKQFVSFTVDLLKNDNKRALLAKNCSEFVKDNFEEHIILEKWHSVFVDIMNEKKVEHFRITSHLKNNYKWLRCINSKIRRVLPFVPPVVWWENLPLFLKHIFKI